MGKHNDDHLKGFLYHTQVRLPGHHLLADEEKV